MSIYSSSTYVNYNNNDDDEEEEEQQQTNQKDEYTNLKECTVYAIDCRPSMFTRDEFGNIPFYVALKSILNKLLDKINTRPSDQVAIVLFGTTEKNNMVNKDHIYILQPLDMLDAPRIKELDHYIKNEEIIQDRFGSTDAVFPLSDLFWTCLDILSNGPKLALKRVILITDNDDPTGGNPTYRRTAIQRAKDLKNIGIEIVLFGINDPDHEFDKILFYQDAVQFENDQVDEEKDELNQQLLSSTGHITELFEKISTFQTTTRSEFRLPFEIAPGLTIGVRGYNMVIEQKLGAPAYFYADQEQLQEVKSTTRWKCADTDEYLTPLDIKKAFSYGGENVLFSNEEIQKLHTVREPSLKVLGFREIKALKAYHQISHPYFVYPDESQYKESKSVFLLLLNSLLKKKQMAVCSFIRRINTLPKIVALLPQAEKLDKEGNQIDSPGFQLIILPYADEIRPVPPYTIPSGFEKGRDIATEMIEKLTIKEGYNAMHYHNPYLENFKNMIQTIALDQTEEAEFKDQTIPNYKWIETEAANEIGEFNEAVGLDKVIIEDIADAKRKVSDGDENSNIKKKPKLNEMTVQEHWENGSLTKVTNLSLQEFLTAAGIQPKKKKADLIDQIDGYLKTKKEQKS